MISRKLILLLVVLAALPLPARQRSVRSGDLEAPAAWIRHRSIRFAPDSDLQPFLRFTAGARVVALGDATHGTHESLEAKARLVPLLVAAGFRTIAFEAPYAEYARIDRYLADGAGDPSELIRFSPYWFWDSEEILSVLRWARAQNEAGLTPPIRIAGVDSTEPLSARDVVLEYVNRVDPASYADIEERYLCIKVLYFESNRCRRSVESVRPILESKGSLYTEEILYAARVVEQGERVLATRHAARDEFMAENILRLTARGERVIVLGHNEHWGRTPYRLVRPDYLNSAGMYLADSLGREYFSLGSVLLDGTFLAIDFESSGIGTIRPQVMTLPSPDDFGVLLAQADLDSMIVPLRGPLPAWLQGTRRIRIAGSVVQSREKTTLDLPADLGAKFDAVLFVRRSTPTHLRHWPTFK